MDYFRISQSIKDRILNPYLTPPPDAHPVKGGKPGEHGWWEEPVTIESFEHSKDEETGDETVRIGVRVDLTTSTENQGKRHTEFFNFPAEALEDGAKEGKVQQFEIAYRNLVAAYRACGNEGAPDPGDISPEEMQGMKVKVSFVLKPHWDDPERSQQQISRWNAPGL